MPQEFSVTYRVHAILRMGQRNISENEVEQVLRRGEVIERYDDDTPYPSCLMLLESQERALHVVVAWNDENNEWIVITVYEPDADRWYPDNKRRRS